MRGSHSAPQSQYARPAHGVGDGKQSQVSAPHAPQHAIPGTQMQGFVTVRWQTSSSLHALPAPSHGS
jgi:hypothetical protein